MKLVFTTIFVSKKQLYEPLLLIKAMNYTVDKKMNVPNMVGCYQLRGEEGLA
jgi:hypothetical protein